MNMEAEDLRKFIRSRTALNLRELARLIDYDPASFHQWLQEKRSLPAEKAEKLEELLKLYGYKSVKNEV